jgi:outer membrane protein assembly factor BamB
MKTRIGIILFCLFGFLFFISFNSISQAAQLLGITGTPQFLPLVMRPGSTPTVTPQLSPTPTPSPTPIPGSISWGMFQHDLQHTGRSPYSGPSTSSLLWDFPVSGVPSSFAVGGDGTIYLPAGMLDSNFIGYLYAIHPDGTQKWCTQLNILPSSSAPAIGPDGTIYVHGNGTEGNTVAIEKLHAITPGGVITWTFEFNGGAGIFTSYVQSSPAVAPDGTLYVASNDTNLYALNPNGTIKWTYSAGLSSINSSPALSPDGNTVYIVNASTRLYAISSSGVFQWSFQLSDTYMGTVNDQSPSVGTDGTIYVGSPDDHLYAVNPDGTLKWRFLTGWTIYSTPALAADGTIYVGSDGLYALNPDDGTQKWKFSSTLYSSVSPIIGADGIIYWRDNWAYYAVNPNGTQKWSFSVRPYPNGLDSTSALTSDWTLYVPHARSLSSGENGLSAYRAAP